MTAAHAEQAARLSVIALHFERPRPRVFHLMSENEEPGVGPLRRSFGPAFGLEPPAALYSGTAEQIEQYVLPTIENAWPSFTAISEPSGGSDPARAIRTTAVKEGDTVVEISTDKVDMELPAPASGTITEILE